MERIRRAGWIVLAAVAAVLDLWSKAKWQYPPGPEHFDGALRPTDFAVLENWLHVHTKWNEGGAWSTRIPGSILFWGTVAAVPALLLWIFWSRRASAWDTAAKSLVLGGAVGNLYDRWKWQMVRDWIDVCFGNAAGWHYPTFNVADVALVAGIVMLLLGGLRKRPAEVP